MRQIFYSMSPSPRPPVGHFLMFFTPARRRRTSRRVVWRRAARSRCITPMHRDLAPGLPSYSAAMHRPRGHVELLKLIWFARSAQPRPPSPSPTPSPFSPGISTSSPGLVFHFSNRFLAPPLSAAVASVKPNHAR